MGSFSLKCCCGCNTEITPQYEGERNTDCENCGSEILDGLPIVVLMPDGNHIEGTYGDYGYVQQDGKTVFEWYAWAAKANFAVHNTHQQGTEAFWNETRNYKDSHEDKKEEEARIAGIYAGTIWKDRETGTIMTYHQRESLGESKESGYLWSDEFNNQWEKIEGTPKYPIKVLWNKHYDGQSYEDMDASEYAPNQGFGNGVKRNCCGMLVCHECDDECSDYCEVCGDCLGHFSDICCEPEEE
jgi:hypothetical protein